MEKKGKKDFVEKVYGKENVDDYLTVLEEQTVSFKYKPFVEIVENQRAGKFISVGVKEIDVTKIILKNVRNQMVVRVKFGYLEDQQHLDTVLKMMKQFQHI